MLGHDYAPGGREIAWETTGIGSEWFASEIIL